ncbi:MAG TPA: hypothetical protein VMT91_06805 [Anaerolineales bacterium]|nr:hypothetical protein [Anaerolineales bacterium]
MKRFSMLLPIFVISLLAACQIAPSQPVFSPTTEVLRTPTPIRSATEAELAFADSATPVRLPTQYLEFSDLSAAQKAAWFPVGLPDSLPDNLPFYKAWISDYEDGSQNIRVVYMELGDPLDANLKSIDIQMTKTNQPITLDSILHQFKGTAQDVRTVQVRGQEGFSYWTPSAAAGNSAVLTWREGSVNFRISLSGNWPAPDESHPYVLDELLLKIAESLQTKP